MSAAERAYRLLLLAYPAAFRTEFGREMALVFRDQQREYGAGVVRFWAATLWDVARSAPTLRLEAVRVQWNMDTQIREGKMKPMAILAILIGTMEAVNALAEGWAGGLNRDASSLAALAFAVAAGVLLVVAGAQLLRRSPGAALVARGAAAACLVVFVIITLAKPMLSIFSTMLGIGFPIALLLFFYWTRGRGPAISTTA